jgi:apolipoprotein N-acyltransferase
VLIRIVAALAIGWLLRFVVGLTPVWWLAWLVPMPLLLLAFRCTPAQARALVALAALIGTSANLGYYRLVVPLPLALLLMAAQALLWVFVVLVTRRIVMSSRSWWTVFAYPVLWVAIDTLMAALLHDGNWGSLAYTQADVLPLLQLTSLLGVAGLLFLVGLVPATLALAIHWRGSLQRGWIAYASTAIFLVAAVTFGELRLRQPLTGDNVVLGLAAVDDAIDPHASGPYAANILQQYDRHVAALAARGARIVVLPEEMARLRPAQAEQWRQHLGALAASHRVWLDAGIGIDDGRRPQNWAWLFAPDGSLSAAYEKHKLAPPERLQHFSRGTDYAVRRIDGHPFGLAICKDMHFASLGRDYGKLGVSVMLVPAWDFNFMDKWLESRTTATRGVENGYAVVRVARESLLSVSDAYGRVLAQRDSSAMPGSTLLVTLPVARQLPTLFTRIGNVFGWLCVVASLVLLIYSVGARPINAAPRDPA